ncbi:lysine methyltransferase 5Ab [Channa argus]|uniref:lysine methyltransferase 5Ab n=1 Tax=Channa argus TaxID=215402 RepID=UPI0029485517|nr:hypothetical protein Q8A73_011823 [Channa argus]
MAKGKKNVMKTDKRPRDSIELTVTSQNETKENKKATEKDCTDKVQSIFSLRSPSKPRSPLSESSSMLILEENESDTTNSDLSKLGNDIPNESRCESCESKEQNPEMACPSRGVKEQATVQVEQKESRRLSNARSATDDKVSASKPQSRSGRKHGSKKMENIAQQNRKVTDYYPIRRSNRKTKGELKNEEHRHIDDLIKNGIEEGMQIKHIQGKGRGVFAVKGFKKGEFVVEYHGALLEQAEAKKREAQYAKDPQTGCYMYYFQYQSKTYCVDATKETSRLGRLVNHSKTGNCQTKLHAIDGTPHLILVASRDIKPEEELLYDYGDRSKASILAHPWLKY